MSNPLPPPSPSPSPGTEEQLQDALEALAEGVRPAPGAYRAAHGDWQRREQRRRLVLAVLITVVFTLATLIGLWVLNQAPSRPGVIFDDRGTTSESLPAGRAGPCPLPENCPTSPVNQMSPLGNS